MMVFRHLDNGFLETLGLDLSGGELNGDALEMGMVSSRYGGVVRKEDGAEETRRRGSKERRSHTARTMGSASQEITQNYDLQIEGRTSVFNSHQKKPLSI